MSELTPIEKVKQELEDKKVAKSYLFEFENGIKKELNDFKAVLLDFRPKHEINYVLDTEQIKSLNNTLNNVCLKLQDISIPSNILVTEKKEHKITFTDSTTKWLTWFCSILFLITIGSVCYGYIAYQNVNKSNLEQYNIGKLKGREEIYGISTKAGKKRIDNTYPYWREVK